MFWCVFLGHWIINLKVMDKKVLVVDLDGTLYRCNTFHKFLKFLAKHYWVNFQFIALARLLSNIVLRGLRAISHRRLKYNILASLRNSSIDLQPFVSSLAPYLNTIKEISDETYAIRILATAAPSCYAEVLSEKHKFTICLGTENPDKGFASFRENINENKRASLEQYLKSQNLNTVDICITDHIDDAPLIKLSKHSIIYNPDSEFRNWLNKNFIDFKERNL